MRNMPVDSKDIEVCCGDEKSKPSDFTVQCLFIRCFLEIKFADMRLISLEQVTINTCKTIRNHTRRLLTLTVNMNSPVRSNMTQ